MSHIPQVYDLVDAFAKRPGAEGYRGAAKKIELLCEFVRFREIVKVDFPTFLDRYHQLYVVPDGEPSRDPRDVVDRLLPRSKSGAAAANTRQWAADEVLELLKLYVGTVMDAEGENQPVPDLTAMLSSGVPAQYLEGRFDAIIPAKRRGRPPQNPSPNQSPPPAIPTPHTATTTPVVETTAKRADDGGQYADGTVVTFVESSAQASREYRGVVVGRESADGLWYYNLITDYGELFYGIRSDVVRRYSGELPAVSPASEYRIRLDDAEVAEIVEKLRLRGSREVDGLQYHRVHMIPGCGEFAAMFEIAIQSSGAAGLTVSLCTAEQHPKFVCVADGPPRRRPFGYYDFRMPDDSVCRVYVPKPPTATL